MIYSVSTANLVIDKETAEKNFPLLKKAGFGAIDLNFEAGNSWMMFPKPLWDDAVIMLGKICKYFVDTYFL